MYGKSSGMKSNYIPMKKGGAGGVRGVLNGQGKYAQTNPSVMKNSGGSGKPPGRGSRVHNVGGNTNRKGY